MHCYYRILRGLNQEHSDQSISGPPSYEEALSESRSPEQNERYITAAKNDA